MNVRDNRFVRAKRVKAQREAAFVHTMAACRKAYILHPSLLLRPPGSTVVVTMERESPGKLDDDNLRSALKACRDGIADALGSDDRNPRIKWHYGQTHGKRYAVIVAISTR